MDDLAKRTTEFGEALQRLALFVPVSKEEMGRWYEEAEILKRDYLYGSNGLAPYLSFFIWHYLADADIRMKSTDYAAVQQDRVSQLITNLKQGVLPSDEDT
ncbi:MAG: hypothetical protein ACJ73D_10300 [Pyrinomonadaceae bacterium]